MNFKAILITVWIWFPALTTAYDTFSGTFLVCDSPECIERAQLVNESLNTSIDPCTDFYSYVCGRWESNHAPPDGWKSYDVYQEIRKNIPAMLRDILRNRTLVENSHTIIDKVASMYNACLALPDTSDAFIRVLNESGFNDWPILPEENIFSSANSKDLLRNMSMSAILYMEISKKHPNNRKPVYHYEIYVKTMPFKEEIKKVRNITALISSTIKFLKPRMETSVLATLTNQLVELFQNLSDVMPEYTGSKRTISQLEKDFGNKFPIAAFLKKKFNMANITLNDRDEVLVPPFDSEKISALLGTFNPNTLYNYAGFVSLFPYLKFAQMSNQIELTMSTTKSRNWSECITLLDESVPDLLDYLYITNEPNHYAIKNEVDNIARTLIQAFNETLQNVSWIDEKTRQAFEKELQAPLEIGYPDALLNMSVLEAFYKYVPHFPSNISFTEAFYYFQENLYKMELRKFRHAEESNWRSVQSPRKGRSKFHEKFGINIEIPYPILVSPVFQRGLPRSLNYGGIGGTIARELGSTFSFDGMQRILKKPKAIELTESRTPCFDEKYEMANNKMLVEQGLEKKVPNSWAGTDQALADNTGLQTAFKAYSRVLQDECANVDTRLIGLENITGMQLFFISNARTQCRITHKDTLYNDIVQWPFTPARNRVNEAMKNLEAFATAFNCQRGSPMHPNKTCPFW